VVEPDYSKEYSGTLETTVDLTEVKLLNDDQALRILELQWLDKGGLVSRKASLEFKKYEKTKCVYSRNSWEFIATNDGIEVYKDTGEHRMKLETPLAWEKS